MNNKQLVSALQLKMIAEQDKFRDWLLAKPPEEILNHAFEYSVRQDIVLLIDYAQLSSKDVRTLLSSPTPLADVYDAFNGMDTGIMDTIQASVKDSANMIRQTKQHTQKVVPKKQSVLSKLQSKTREMPTLHTPRKEQGAR